MKIRFIIILIALSIVACKKQDQWLDFKSSKSDVVPSTLEDYQAILDNNSIMNENYPAMGMVAADNYYLTPAVWKALTDIPRKNAYIWLSDINEGSVTALSPDWDNPYKMIEYANIALSGLQKMEVSSENNAVYNNIKGSSLFFRALAFYNLAQIYAPPYNANTASIDKGIIIRLTDNVGEKSVRSSIQATYNQILSDLLAAQDLLPVTPLYKTRPSKTAVAALLSKTYLLMGDYNHAKTYSDQALSQNNNLLDFNTLNTLPTYSFPTFTGNNPEIIFYAVSQSYSPVNAARLLMVPSFYNSYNVNDLRKAMFFRSNSGGFFFTGKYTGGSGFFSGLASNELYLIRSECNARLGNMTAALADLNLLLQMRWNKNVTYIPYNNSNSDLVLTKILDERRKELPFTSNTRWEDLRRLNTDPRFAITLTRSIDNVIYSLLPNDSRYTFLIPQIEILKSGIEQNIR
ncbi:hypothetical protein A0O34_21580 [Chryseobacterium glaciei]|uniref:Carbohydrate-binding protein SusD n=1 Tax=Chryseobacterium glaciei TaxID=1685010 RepID=A0A172Y165_9FLAO|nr:RagB/SusD family nutrient uptake outer membrane protein [Chryseobacterium glaciei]ANF52954.1 hypothetical protein A0O34_21580 [Chryseobacterium glaciei]